MAEKTKEQKESEAKRQAEARAKTGENLKNILTFPGRAMEATYGAVLEGGVAFVNRAKLDTYTRELRDAQYTYNNNPSTKNKERLRTAQSEYNQARREYDRTGTTSSGKTTYTDRPSNPVGELVGPTGSLGADSPSERAKTAALNLSPNYIPINPLDNNRWKNAFDVIVDGEGKPTELVYWKQDETMVPISFFPNSVGSIYQTTDGTAETLNSAVARIMDEYAASGKMNELRDLLVSSGIANSKTEIDAMSIAKVGENAAFSKYDANTRAMVTKAVILGTKLNLTAVDTDKKAQTFEQFLKGNYADYYAKDKTVDGLPKRTVSIRKQDFTPEDLELNIDAFFQEYTGQGASKEDLDYLVKRLNAQSSQKTVTVRGEGTETSTVTGGVSQQEQQLMMREMALNDPAAESYNKATTYLDYFRESLASPIELG